MSPFQPLVYIRDRDVRPLAMSCLNRCKISLLPKHQLIVPSTLLALATNIRTYKATKIHTLTDT